MKNLNKRLTFFINKFEDFKNINENNLSNDILKEYVKHKEEELSVVLKIRKHANGKFKRRDELRLDSNIDYARILYSSLFRRLQEKM